MIDTFLGPGAGLASVHFFTNLALFVLGAEILAILFLGERIGLHRRYLPNAFAGFFIMTALWLHLNSFAPVAVFSSLFFSLLAHGADLWVRRQQHG